MEPRNLHRRPKTISRRATLGLGFAGLTGTGLLGYRALNSLNSTPSGPVSSATSLDSREESRARLLGDGSTADTGAQPGARKFKRLESGERPPQFVVISWDGAGALDDNLFSRFRNVAADVDAHMTFFLSGLYLLPETKKDIYHPPLNPIGSSAIGYLSDDHIKNTIREIRSAWLEGHEIGTHFNGHFCSGPGSVEKWTSEMWQSEIDQAISFVTSWRTNTGFTDLEPLPFDYRKELVGARTPCLLGQNRLLPAARDLGWRYDASSPGGLQVWPSKNGGIWNFPLQAVPFPGHKFEVLTMDYNIMANQSGQATQGSLSSRATWREQARGAYFGGFKRSYYSNRAPLFIGNHFESWNGGIYMDAVEEAVKDMAAFSDVQFVSFRELCDWLDVQDSAVLNKLCELSVGEKPSNWSHVTSSKK
ncbi:hypothetical protein ACIP5U_39370 [Streptomyces sp. NPDC088788]|uniref:hypothetical protein n=1 Tax=Streptomyces sp. NPDC088788 TaxID=3365898 RepID=UPI0038003EEC